MKPPFEIYHNGVEIADADGHVCTAESPEIAKDMVMALNAMITEDEPVTWLVTYTMKQSGPQASAYIKEADARNAACNVEKYAHASNVEVFPAYRRPTLSSQDGGPRG